MGRATQALGEVRIIGGRDRGRRLRFPEVSGLRPTGDRVRETLFNWLQPVIGGARCLDLFAGSGALGFEAASRGAVRVMMLDLSPVAVRQLRENVRLLEATEVQIERADGLEWLKGNPEVFDVVFLDPPFSADLLETCCRRLEQNGWLAPSSLIYLESDGENGATVVPDNWQTQREKRAGSVRYSLLRRTSPEQVGAAIC